MKTITPANFDPLEGAEIMTLMGLDPARMSIPRVAAQFEDILRHFAGSPDKRQTILKVMMKSGDKLDNLWTYVQLQKEKQAKLQNFNPEDFEPDVAKEIVSGHITIDKKQRIRESIKKRRETQKHKEQEQQARKQERKEEKAVTAATLDEKLDFYSSQLDELDALDNQLTNYQ